MTERLSWTSDIIWMWTTAKRPESSVEPPPPPQYRLAAASSHWSASNCGRKGRISHSAPFSLEKEGSWVLLFVVLFCCCTAIRYLLFIIPYLSIMVYRIPEDTGIPFLFIATVNGSPYFRARKLTLRTMFLTLYSLSALQENLHTVDCSWYFVQTSTIPLTSQIISHISMWSYVVCQMYERVRKIVRHFESHKTKIQKNYHVPGTSQVPDFSPD